MIEVYIDGASAGDPGPSGAGIFIKGHGKGEQFSVPLGIMTNHEAEYHALIKSLEICLEKGFTIISVRTDSQLVERAVEKEYVKNPAFVPLLEKALSLKNQFELFFIKWIPSKQNSVADQLSRSAIRMNGENER
ncbi:reverse transcriptase-like protein [Metabacillus idriensis]|uniref:Reverse transcriptase-like protein n=1 Tax=Metabacillus idriensis TaxID=324768 RepID=A0A6I2MFG5_9BACI|nr:reverse transcriptase-like protein [Metabacillus idriensis]MCM3596862.1 reverse transcriptase-like protein [Metabacillus idriensis]MRX55786.1 reverse transcriptase-like protein [Metabacillus idriensis]OHR63366.1 ribonuclease H [Bacillus sp. HMSC76G11]